MPIYKLTVDTRGQNEDGLYYALKDYGFQLLKQELIKK